MKIKKYLQRVYVVVHCDAAELLLLEKFLLQCQKRLVYTVLREVALDLEHNLAYILLLHACNGRQVGTKHTMVEKLTHTLAQNVRELLEQRKVTVLGIYIHKAIERRIVEEHTLRELAVVELQIVVCHHHREHRIVGLPCLQIDLAPSVLSSGTSCHLGHKLEGSLRGPEVGVVQQYIGIEYSHHRHIVKVESLGDHLRTNENVGLSLLKIVYYALVGGAGARGVEVHPCGARLGEYFQQVVLNLLCSVAQIDKIVRLAVGAHLGRGYGVSAIVAGESR